MNLLSGNLEVLAVLSLREDGPMKVGVENGEKNRDRFFESLNFSSKNVVSAGITHENAVAVVNNGNAGRVISGVDGLITQTKGIYLSVTVADCLPVFFYAPDKKVVGIAHAGWRGLEKNIIGVLMEKMKERFAVELSGVKVAIGPSIHSCHFAVGEEVASVFEGITPQGIKKKGDVWSVDLPVVARKQLQDIGIKKENIEVSEDCTYCHPERYFSYRRDKDKPVKAMAAVIALR